METGLTPANSHLIDLIESQLLETVSNVNDDEDIAMADDLLDLELDTMILSQSTRPLEMVWDTDSTSTDPPSKALPTILLTQTRWVTKDTETQIAYHRGDKDGTACHLCQQHFTTPRRLRVHLPQHFITTFCPCGEYSYHRDYIIRHQRKMGCYTGHLYDVDEASYPKFLKLIRPLITDPVHYERLSQGFSAPRPITHGPVPKPPRYRIPRTSLLPESIPHPRTLPRVILQRIDTQPCKPSLSSLSSTDRKRR